MNIGILALFFALLLSVACFLSRPQEEAHKHVDCRPIHTVKNVDVPKEVMI